MHIAIKSIVRKPLAPVAEGDHRSVVFIVDLVDIDGPGFLGDSFVTVIVSDLSCVCVNGVSASLTVFLWAPFSKMSSILARQTGVGVSAVPIVCSSASPTLVTIHAFIIGSATLYRQ